MTYNHLTFLLPGFPSHSVPQRFEGGSCLSHAHYSRLLAPPSRLAQSLRSPNSSCTENGSGCKKEQLYLFMFLKYWGQLYETVPTKRLIFKQTHLCLHTCSIYSAPVAGSPYSTSRTAIQTGHSPYPVHSEESSAQGGLLLEPLILAPQGLIQRPCGLCYNPAVRSPPVKGVADSRGPHSLHSVQWEMLLGH